MNNVVHLPTADRKSYFWVPVTDHRLKVVAHELPLLDSLPAEGSIIEVSARYIVKSGGAIKSLGDGRAFYQECHPTEVPTIVSVTPPAQQTLPGIWEGEPR